MASTKLTQEEAAFLASLRRLVARGGTLPVNLDSGLQPIADPRKPQPVQKSTVVEPLAGYWNQSSSFAGFRNGLYPQAPSQETLLNNDKLPGPPRGRGLTLSRKETQVGTPVDLNFMVWADIEFGIGSTKHQVSVDWCNSIINVPASVVRVNARYGILHNFGLAAPYNVGTVTDGVYGQLGVQLAVDPLVSKGWNTYTQVIGDPSLDDVLVPDFAIGFFMGYLQSTVLTGVTKIVNCVNSQVYTSPPGPVSVGLIDSQAIINNCYNQVNYLPQNARMLQFQYSGLPSQLTVITWVMAV